MTDLFLSAARVKVKNNAKCVKNEMVEESSPEVTSSCGRLSSSDFREVDLELWELDAKQQHNQIHHHGRSGILVRTMKSYSETSSASGKILKILICRCWIAQKKIIRKRSGNVEPMKDGH